MWIIYRPNSFLDTPMVSVRLWWVRRTNSCRVGLLTLFLCFSHLPTKTDTFELLNQRFLFAKSRKPHWNWKISQLAACTEDLLQHTMWWRLICQADLIAMGETKGIRSIRQKWGGISPNPSKILASEKHSRNHHHSETKNNMNTFQKLITSPIPSKTRCNPQFLFLLCRYIYIYIYILFLFQHFQLPWNRTEWTKTHRSWWTFSSSFCSFCSISSSVAGRDTIGILWVILTSRNVCLHF